MLPADGEKYDRILELVGALTLTNSMQFIRKNGVACVNGEVGVYLTSFESGALNQEMFDDLFALINDNQIDVSPNKVFDLKHTADARGIWMIMTVW